MNKYLEFNTIEDYLEHLRSQTVSETYLELSNTSGDPGDYGFCSVTAYAVLSYPFEGYVATCGVVLVRTDSLQIKFDRDVPEPERISTKVRNRFAELKSKIIGFGISVKPGIWKYQPPHYLS